MKKLITSFFALLALISMSQAQISWDQVKHSTTETPLADTAYFSIICRGGGYQALCQRTVDSLTVVGNPGATVYLPGDSLVWRTEKGEALGTTPRIRFVNSKTGQYLYTGLKGGATKRTYMGPREDPFNGNKDFIVYDRGPRVPAEYYYGFADAEGSLLGNPSAGTIALGASSLGSDARYMWRFNKKMGPQPKPAALPAPTLEITTTDVILNAGGSITLKIKVTKGANDLLGTTKLYFGSTLLETLSLDVEGNATYTYPTLVYGEQKFAAVYSGDVNYAPQDAILSVTAGPSANAKPVIVTITPSTTATEVHSDVTFDFTVKDSNGDPVSSAGTVRVLINGNIKNTFTPDVLGMGKINFPNLLVGTQVIGAKYVGDKMAYLDSDTAKVSIDITPSTASEIPYPVYFDLGTMPEIMKYRYKYLTPASARTSIKFAADSCQSVQLATDTSKIAKTMYMTWEQKSLSYTSTDLKDLYCAADGINIPFGINARPSFFAIKTPWLNKGSYNIYVSQRTNQASGMIPTVTMDSKELYFPNAEFNVAAPSFRAYPGTNSKRWGAKGHNSSLAMQYFGTVNVASSDVHTLKFTIKNSYGEMCWLDMIQFIPVDQDSLKSSEVATVGLNKLYYPLFDLGGYARSADFAAANVPTSYSKNEELAVPYQVTDLTAYEKKPYILKSLAVSSTELLELGVNYTIVYKKDMWTRVAEGVVNTTDSTFNCELANGDYYYQEFYYIENTQTQGCLGARRLIKEGTFTVGEPNAVNTTNKSSIFTYSNGNILTVKGIKAGARIMITDIMGKVISTTTSSSDVFTKSLKPSIYLVKVVSESDRSVTKLIIK